MSPLKALIVNAQARLRFYGSFKPLLGPFGWDLAPWN